MPDGKSISPDPHRRKVSISRLSCVQNFSCVHRAFKSPHVQTFVRSKLPMSRLTCVPKANSCATKLIICTFMSRLSCVQKFPISRLSCIQNCHVQAFMRSKMPMSWLSCVPKENSCAPVLIICAFTSRLSCVQKLPMSRLSCDQSYLRPDYLAFKIAYVQTFVLPLESLCAPVLIICAFTSRLSCVQKLPMSRLSCDQSYLRPDYLAFKIAYVQTFVLPLESLCAPVLIICAFMPRLSCVQNCLCPDYRAFKVASMSRLSCVQSCLCLDYRAFKVAYVKTIVRSKLPMSRLSCVHWCSPPPCAFISVLTYRLLVWDLSLGNITFNHF